jgi:1,2-diacylglycerol 3-alpha-glucosyltransferase
MAAGLPVLVSERCECAQDLVVPGLNGFRFDPHDVTAIAKAMTEISSGSPDLCAMGRSSRDPVARWSLTRFADGLNSAVLAALRASPRAPGLMDQFLLRALRRR